MPTVSPTALVVLGCPVSPPGEGAPLGALRGPSQRRVETAWRVYAERGGGIVIASGGRSWGGAVEADVFARELCARGIPEEAVVRERLSFSTRENARFVAAILRRRAMDGAVVVTCPWHMPRALALFRLEGLTVTGVAAQGPEVFGLTRAYRVARERVAAWVDGVS